MSFFIGSFNYRTLVGKIKTPFYVYDSEKITSQYQTLLKELGRKIQIRFAIKANSNLSILRLIHEQGGGVEVVSGGELLRVLKAKIPANRIVFSGIGKTEEEIRFAINTSIEQLSVESLEELKKVKEIAQELQKEIPICLRINPNIEANTHAKITTGTSENKFGIPLSQIEEASKLITESTYLTYLGLSVHIGSQIQSVAPYQQMFRVIKEIAAHLKTKGYSFKRLDLGGGFSVPYSADELPFDLESYANALKEELGNLDYELVIEPGRYLVAEAGFLLTKILYIKRTPSRTFVIIDAGMNDMMRPALYDAKHSIIPCKMDTAETELMDIVGPVCESSDCFAKQVSLPKNLQPGNILAITHTGAYGASLSSTYNSRALIPELLVDKDKLFLIRERIDPEHLLTFEIPRCLT